MKGVRLHLEWGRFGFINNVDAMDIINIVSGTEARCSVVRYKSVTSGILLPGEPGRWYVTFFHFLRAEF